jgi:FkbM family methyltransferase
MPTKSPSKYAKKCEGVNKDIGSGCGMTSDTEQHFNKWADSTFGYTDIVCERVAGPMTLGGSFAEPYAPQATATPLESSPPPAAAECPPCVRKPCAPTPAILPAALPAGSQTVMPRGIVHKLLNNLQIDNPYLGTKGVALSLCLDVGGHLGWTAEQVAVHGHRVYVFEPFAGNHKQLALNLARFGDNVKIFKGAVSNIAGEVGFGGGGTGLKEDIESAGEYGKFVAKGSSSDNLINGKGKKVMSYRLDDEVGDTDAVLFLKIDVQGGELVRSEMIM